MLIILITDKLDVGYCIVVEWVYSTVVEWVLMLWWVIGSIPVAGPKILFLISANLPQQWSGYVLFYLLNGTHKRTLAANQKE